jgi:hypothetical protein
MELRSPEFSDGGAIPQRFTCDGDNLSPALQWSDVPDEASEIALVCEDPDAPGKTFVHWLLWGIDCGVQKLDYAFDWDFSSTSFLGELRLATGSELSGLVVRVLEDRSGQPPKASIRDRVFCPATAQSTVRRPRSAWQAVLAPDK